MSTSSKMKWVGRYFPFCFAISLLTPANLRGQAASAGSVAGLRPGVVKHDRGRNVHTRGDSHEKEWCVYRLV